VIFELKEKVAAAGIAAAGTVVAGVPSDGDVVGALQALGYSLAEARDAARVALAGPSATDTLEDRVKAALRALARE